MRQAHVHEHQVIGTVTQFQCFIDPGEEGEYLLVVLNIGRFHGFFGSHHAIELRQEIASEMDPVNSPGIFSCTAIGMLFMLRQHKEFIRAYGELLVADLVPAMAIYTIEQEVFRQPFLPVGVMPFGTGIIAQAAQMHLFEPVVIVHPGFQYRLGYFNALATQPIPDIFMRPSFVIRIHVMRAVKDIDCYPGIAPVKILFLT